MPDLKIIQTNNRIATILTNTTNTLITTAGANGGWITELKAVNTGGTATTLILYRDTNKIIDTVSVPANSGNNGTLRSLDILSLISKVTDETGNLIFELSGTATLHIKIVTYSSDIHITGNRGDF